MAATRELFQKHRLRCTRQRMALYDALRQCTSHPTAEELFCMVRSNGGGLSRATVYNTLEALCQAGLAHRMPAANGCCRYDADTTDHLHFRCRETAKVIDVPANLGEKLLQNIPRQVLSEIEEAMGVRIDAVTVQLLGSRSSCA